ncbi:MAG: hypothetical protein ACKVZJ_14040 [Phycisphaerales bacterium]
MNAALEITRKNVLDPAVIRASGAGKAYQSVAQSCAITVQDGSDYLRAILTISATAIGMGTALVAADDPRGQPLIEAGQKIATQAVTLFSTIGQTAGTVLTGFPSS